MIVSGRKPAEDDRDIGMKPFDNFCEGQCSLDMGHPMEIDPEGHGLIFLDEPLHIEFLILEHLHGHIDDPDLETVAFEKFRQAGKPDGIHFKDGRGRNDITDGAVNPGPLSEVVKGGGMEKDEIDACHLRHFGETGCSGVWVFAL